MTKQEAFEKLESVEVEIKKLQDWAYSEECPEDIPVCFVSQIDSILRQLSYSKSDLI